MRAGLVHRRHDQRFESRLKLIDLATLLIGMEAHSLLSYGSRTCMADRSRHQDSSDRTSCDPCREGSER